MRTGKVDSVAANLLASLESDGLAVYVAISVCIGNGVHDGDNIIA